MAYHVQVTGKNGDFTNFFHQATVQLGNYRCLTKASTLITCSLLNSAEAGNSTTLDLFNLRGFFSSIAELLKDSLSSVSINISLDPSMPKSTKEIVK